MSDDETMESKPDNESEEVDLGKKGKFKVHKGALHEALGVKVGTKIPVAKMRAAANSKDPHVRRMAASAAGFKAMKKPKYKR